jgi:tetratricopeptide (TPR) repeat protein
VWGILWFGAAHLPDTGIAIPVNSFFLEHWMYLPSAGLFLGIAETVQRFIQPKLVSLLFRRTVGGILLCIIFALGTATIMQNRVWNNAISFYTHMFQYTVVSARGHNNLAIAYMDKGQLDEAVAEYHKAIATSDTYPETRHNLAICLLKYPDQAAHWDDAISNLKRATEIDPNFYRSYGMLGVMYHFKGQDDIAVPYANKSLELKARLNK